MPAARVLPRFPAGSFSAAPTRADSIPHLTRTSFPDHAHGHERKDWLASLATFLNLQLPNRRLAYRSVTVAFAALVAADGLAVASGGAYASTGQPAGVW